MKTNPKTEIEDVKYVVVNISDSNKDTFVQEIRNKNKRVIYEVFTKNNKNDSFKED